MNLNEKKVLFDVAYIAYKKNCDILISQKTPLKHIVLQKFLWKEIIHRLVYADLDNEFMDYIEIKKSDREIKNITTCDIYKPIKKSNLYKT